MNYGSERMAYTQHFPINRLSNANIERDERTDGKIYLRVYPWIIANVRRSWQGVRIRGASDEQIG